MPKKGYKQTEETKIKLSKIRKINFLGKKNPMWGRKHSEETKKKLKENHYSKKEGYVNPKSMLGKKHSLKTIEKMILSHTGIISPQKGIHISKEHRQHIINSMNKPEIIKKIKAWRKNVIIPYHDTKIELKIQNFLKELHIEFLAHNYISEITNAYQCDIFIPSIKTIIECDGCYWHGCSICNKNLIDFQIEHMERDKLRTKELQEKGYKVIRLWEHDIKKMELNDLKEKL